MPTMRMAIASAWRGTETGQGAFIDVAYDYDSLDRLDVLSESIAAFSADYDYDRLSRRTALRRTLPLNASRTGYDYNTAGDLELLEHHLNPGPAPGSGDLLSRFAYSYGPLGFRDGMTEDRPAFGVSAAAHAYGYDAFQSPAHGIAPGRSRRRLHLR